MRNSLLSIGEAAKLKNVSIKALHYYEKLGVFMPAYVDPESGYRYYSPAQLFDLDVILTCSELGIPLKRILDYRNEYGTLDLRQLLHEGADLAEQKLQRAQKSLLQINSCLEEISHQDTYRHSQAPYTRTLDAAYIYAAPWDLTVPFEVKRYLKTMSDLYKQADLLDTTPLYFQGLLINTQTSPFICSAYVQIDPYPNQSIDETLHYSVTNKASFSRIGRHTYKGFRIEHTSLSECVNNALDYTKDRPGYYLMTEVWDAELSSNSYVVELLQQVVES